VKVLKLLPVTVLNAFMQKKVVSDVYKGKVKVKQSLYGPSQALTVPGGGGSQILRQSAHECGKVVSPTHRPPLPPGYIPGTHLC
jgi:hypothetical protein